MRINTLQLIPADSFGEEDQMSFPFADKLPPTPRPPITHRQLVEIGSSHRRRVYQSVVHQDPATLAVLSHSLRLLTADQP